MIKDLSPTSLQHIFRDIFKLNILLTLVKCFQNYHLKYVRKIRGLLTKHIKLFQKLLKSHCNMNICMHARKTQHFLSRCQVFFFLKNIQLALLLEKCNSLNIAKLLILNEEKFMNISTN